jgi:hypothetical protein
MALKDNESDWHADEGRADWLPRSGSDDSSPRKRSSKLAFVDSVELESEDEEATAWSVMARESFANRPNVRWRVILKGDFKRLVFFHPCFLSGEVSKPPPAMVPRGKGSL